MQCADSMAQMEAWQARQTKAMSRARRWDVPCSKPIVYREVVVEPEWQRSGRVVMYGRRVVVMWNVGKERGKI